MTLIDLKDGTWEVRCGMAVDGDGSPRCYAPNGANLSPLDYLANAGHQGDWYGIACDPHGTPYIQGVTAPVARPETEGYYVSTTSFERRGYRVNDPARYLDAEKVPYIVVPSHFRRAVPGVVLGCRALVTYNDGPPQDAVAGDVGPAFGEGSVLLCQRLGIPGSPRNGGVMSGVRILIYPGTPAVVDGFTYALQPA